MARGDIPCSQSSLAHFAYDDQNEAIWEWYRYRMKEAQLYRDITVEMLTWREHLVDVFLFCLFFNLHREPSPTYEATPTPTSYSSCFECLSNVFLALAAFPGSVASEVQAGQRVWNAVWTALASARSSVEAVLRSARAAVWDVAVGVLWGVGTVWKGKNSKFCSKLVILLAGISTHDEPMSYCR